VPPEIVDRLLVDQVQNGKRQHEVGNLPEGEVSEQPHVPVVALHVGVRHGDEVVAPGRRLLRGEPQRVVDCVVDDVLAKKSHGSFQFREINSELSFRFLAGLFSLGVNGGWI
jgi:hypothetical protein